MKHSYLFLISLLATAGSAFANPSTLEIRKKGETEVRNIIEPVLSQFCREQCRVISVDVEVDIAVDEEVAPGFDESTGMATLAPASAKAKVLIDQNLGNQTKAKIVNLLKENLESLRYPVQIETRSTSFPQPVAASYKVAELKDRIYRDVKSGLGALLSQLCATHCVLGELNIQAEQVNVDEIDYGNSQEYFQESGAAVRVSSVRAVLMLSDSLSPEERSSILQMARIKLSQFKNSNIEGQVMRFPKPVEMGVSGPSGTATGGSVAGRGIVGANETRETSTDSKSESSKLESKESLQRSDTLNRRESETTTEATKRTEASNSSETNERNDNRQEKVEKYERIERVENGDAVQQKLDTFRNYALVIAAIMLALLVTVVAISFRAVSQGQNRNQSDQNRNEGGQRGYSAIPGDGAHSGLSSDEKAALLGKRIESDRLFGELTNIFSEQPKVAKHVFGQVLAEEGVETTAQYVELFGETVMLDLLRDPGLQGDLAELMDFYARNTFDINDDERLHLLKRLHHRTVSAKMLVHGSRASNQFDFLAEMDTPQVVEMIKNESNTVKAIVITQCDTKKRQSVFAQQDEPNRLKLMTELSRIDHLPKAYIYNVAAALKRKKNENPKLNTEALPGTDVLVSFLERSSIATQKNILQQLMSQSSDVLYALKGKLISVETLRFIRDHHVVEIVAGIKHEDLIQFLQGCSLEVRETLMMKGPRDLMAEIQDQLQQIEPASRDQYLAVERKVLNRIKSLSGQGTINLNDVNERMFAQEFGFGVSREVA